MGFYYAREKKKFDAEWEKTAAWYKSEGMSDEDIEKMRLFDWAQFCRQRSYENRTQPLPEEYFDDENGSTLFQKFEQLTVTVDSETFQSRYLTVEKKPGRSVPVGVWEVTQADEKALDRYEGFPNFYYKKELTLPIKGIRTGKVRKRRVFVYIMHENRPIGIPSIPYMQTCIQGYDDFGFDRLVLIDAYLKCGEEYYEGE